MISYMSTMHSLVWYTSWGAQIGEIGGLLEYHPFGQSFVYHVTKDNLRGRLLLSFPDVTSYLLLSLVVFNAVGLFVGKETESGWGHVRKLALRNVIITALCMFFYVWWTMSCIEYHLNWQPAIGGVVDYVSFFVIQVTHVAYGSIESSPNWRTYDFTLWLLLLLLISTLITIRRQLTANRV